MPLWPSVHAGARRASKALTDPLGVRKIRIWLRVTLSERALLLPIEQIEERWPEIPKDGRTTLIYCAVGERSAAACEILSLQGYTNLHNLDGGIMSWSGPVERPSD